MQARNLTFFSSADCITVKQDRFQLHTQRHGNIYDFAILSLFVRFFCRLSLVFQVLMLVHFLEMQRRLTKLSLTYPIGSLRFDDGTVNDVTNQWFDWLNEEKYSCCTCGTLFGPKAWRSLPNDDVKFSFLRLWRQRELAAVNLSLFAFTWKPFVPSKRKCGSPTLYNVINME